MPSATKPKSVMRSRGARRFVPPTVEPALLTLALLTLLGSLWALWSMPLNEIGLSYFIGDGNGKVLVTTLGCGQAVVELEVHRYKDLRPEEDRRGLQRIEWSSQLLWESEWRKNGERVAAVVLPVGPVLGGAAGLSLVVAVYILFLWFGGTDAREPVHPRCRKCGYDLRATPYRCPECGTYRTPRVAFPPGVPDPGRLGMLLVLAIPLIVIIAAYLLIHVPDWLDPCSSPSAQPAMAAQL